MPATHPVYHFDIPKRITTLNNVIHYQASLFDAPPQEESPSPEKRGYQLQIEAIPPDFRVHPDHLCRLIHPESGLKIPGAFTYSEAVEILESTRNWDFTLNGREPRCAALLLALIESITDENNNEKGE